MIRNPDMIKELMYHLKENFADRFFLCVCVFHLGLVFTLSVEKQKKIVIHPAQSQAAETQLGGG